MTEKRDRPVYVDEDIHTELAVMAARRKVSIKQVLKELVEKALKEQDGE